jgi:hypothetical protein
MSLTSTGLNAQCAHIFDQAFPGSNGCGCWETNIRITDLPTNIIRKLVMTVRINDPNLSNNNSGIIWNEQYILNNLHPFFTSGGTLTTTFTQSNTFHIFYENFANFIPIQNNEVLFPISFCNVPGSDVLVFLETNSSDPFRYGIGINNVQCTPTFGGPVIRPFPKRTINGNVQRPLGTSNCEDAINNGVPNATVSLLDICNDYNPPIVYGSITNQQGNFSIDGQFNGHYRHTISKNDHVLCGVDNFDLFLIREAILNRLPFVYPWQLIAADVNFSNTITTTDILTIQSMMADPASGLWPSWRILTLSSYAQVPLGLSYPPINDFLIYDPLNNNINGQIWIGIKMGDVSGNCTDCEGQYQLQDDDQLIMRSNAYDNLPIQTHEPIWLKDGTCYLPLSFESNLSVGMFSFSTLPSGYIDVLGVYSECALDHELPILIVDREYDQYVSTIYMEECIASADSPIMYLHLKGYDPSKQTSPFLDINNVGQLFDHDGKEYKVYHRTKEGNEFNPEMFLYPNPANQHVNIRLNQVSNDGHITIINELGQTMDRIQLSIPNNGGTIEINTSSWLPGIYIAVMQIGQKTITQKFIIKH